MSAQAPHRTVIVSGYPKSGNTWTTRLVAEAIGCPVKGFWGSDHNEIAIEGAERDSEFLVYKAHHAYEHLCRIGRFEKLIYVLRDPRDIVCSGAHYFQSKMYNEHYGTNIDKYEAMIRTIVDGSIYPQCRRPWREHVADYIERDMFLVRYEELAARPLDILSAAMGFLGVEVAPEKLQRAIDRQSFDSRKTRALAANDRRNANFLRKGRPGSYRDELSQAQCDRIVAGCQPEMARLGYR